MIKMAGRSDDQVRCPVSGGCRLSRHLPHRGGLEAKSATVAAIFSCWRFVATGILFPHLAVACVATYSYAQEFQTPEAPHLQAHLHLQPSNPMLELERKRCETPECKKLYQELLRVFGISGGPFSSVVPCDGEVLSNLECERKTDRQKLFHGIFHKLEPEKQRSLKFVSLRGRVGRCYVYRHCAHRINTCQIHIKIDL